MAKKLNKKIVVIGIVLLAMMVCALVGGLAYLKVHRDPDRALNKARRALEMQDYKEAEAQYGRSYAFGKDDEYKIQRLFELAQFYLIQNPQHEAEWNKAMGCWSKIITIDAKNLDARKKLLDFYYQAADAGDGRAWKNVLENTTQLIDLVKGQGMEPDSHLLTVHAKALLAVARRGETTDRPKYLNDAVACLEQLIEKEPGREELYLLRAEAAGIQGELDAQSGVINASQNAQQKAAEYLQMGIDQSDDKATAAANLIRYKLGPALGDPNAIEKIRAEVETFRQQVQPNDEFWMVVSMAYEFPGKMTAEAELNQAIEAVRQARELKPEKFEYTFRLARLMYRKGNAFADPQAMADALQIAEEALSMEEVQDIPGPLQGRNLNYRFILNTFLADLFLEKALIAKWEGKTPEAEALTAKAEANVSVINAILGTMDSPIAQKYQGLLALLRDQKDKAVQLLYKKSYEKDRALDKPQEFSNTDPLVCWALAEIMKQEGEPGMQREFLQWAVYNNSRFVLQKPQIILDYAEILGQLRAWANTARLVEEYQSRYGANKKSRELAAQAAIASDRFEQAEKLLATMDAAAAETRQLRLRLLNRQIAQAAMEIAAAREAKEPKEPSAQQVKAVEKLRSQRDAVLEQIFKTDVKQIDPQPLSVVCVDLLQNKQIPKAIGYLDQYLAANPDAYGLQVIRLQAAQDDPLNLTAAQRTQLQEQAIGRIQNPKQKALLLAEYYRSQKDYEKALSALTADASLDADNDPELLRVRFEIAFEQKDIAGLEGLLQTMRAKNVDRCEGKLSVAQVEILKENYTQAMRYLDECLTVRPLFSYLHFLKSQVQYQLKQSEAAIQSARTAVQMNPQNPAYIRQFASLLFARNSELGSRVTPEQRTEAEQVLTMAMVLNPADWQLQSVYAESIQTQAPDRALAIRQQLLADYPTASNALMLGNMAMRMAQLESDAAKRTGLIELAGKAFQQAMDIEPDNETARQTLADYLRMTRQDQKAIEVLKGDENLLWKFYLRGGQIEQAEVILKDLLQKKPDDVLVLQGLLLIAENTGKREELKEYLDKLAQLDQTKEGELLVMQKYIDNGYSAEAEKMLASFRERYPDEKVIFLFEAWIAMGQGRLQEALSLANRYMETEAGNAGAWRLRGRLYRLMNQPQKAIDDLQRSKNIQDNPAVRIELATVYNETRQTTAAIGELVSGLEDPQAPQQIRLMLEELYQRSGRTADLDKFYQSTLEKYPQSTFWYYRAGRYYSEQKDFAKALGLLQKGWEMSVEGGRPNMTLLDYYLDCLFQTGQYDKAMSIASGLIDTPQFAPVVYGYMGQIQHKLGQNQKAVESFWKALEKSGNNDALLEGITRTMLTTVGETAVTDWISKEMAKDAKSLPARLLTLSLAQSKGAYNRAIEQIDQCMEILGPDNPNGLGYSLKKVNLLLMAYGKTADKDYLDRASALLEKLLEVQPDNPSLLNNMAFLLADNDQQLERALGYARKAHQADPGNLVFLDTYAYTQCKNGQYDQAEQNLLRAIQIYEATREPVPWDVYKHLAMTQEGLAKTQQAIETYQKAMDASAQIPENEKAQVQKAIERLRQL